MEPLVWEGLNAMGYDLTQLSGEESGFNGFVIQSDGSLERRTDPRREGLVMIGE